MARWLFLAALCAVGCEARASVSIDLVTDFVPGEEFDTVRVELNGESTSAEVRPSESFVPRA